VSDPPDARAACATAQRREVTQMSKTKKLIATGLAIVSIAAVPSTSIALSGSAPIALACGGTSTGGCQ